MNEIKEELTKYCTKCGKQIDQDTKFCPYCGEEVKEEIVKKESKRGRKKTVKEETIINKVDSEDKVIVEEIKKSEENPKPPIIEVHPEPKKVSSFESKKKYIYPIIATVITFLLCLGAFGLFYNYYLKNLVIETTKREVTVTDKGIAEAVSKVYDSVVVVESYVRDQLYATGTGFVYKKDDNTGYILTNSHVIESADEVRVVFTNNEREKVEIVGSDSYSDIAVLAVDADKVISVAELGSSEDTQVGDTAFAVGAPLDAETYAWTVTRGIVSGKNRTVSVETTNGFQSSSYIMEVLQTDAAINSGNSGGPLCNSNGEVIGITNMKLASSTIEGMGFAIPIETAISYADRFVKGEHISRPYLGITIMNNTPTYRDPDATGVYVESVEKDSPADEGGIKEGDIIIAVNDEEVTDKDFFQYELYKYDIGDEITITVKRDNKTKDLKVKLGSSNTTT